MRILFEDGVLRPILKLRSILKDDLDLYVIDARYGPTACTSGLNRVMQINPNAKIYTNYLGALSFDYSWDKENNKCEAYLYDDEDGWINIQNLTSKELRFAHNIPKMYMAGVFDTKRKY